MKVTDIKQFTNTRQSDEYSNFTAGQLILIVDHYRVGQRIALQQLQYFGLTAQVVSSCRQAIRAIRKHDYALVLIGWSRGRCAGTGCIKVVRREEVKRNTHTTIVAVTAHAEPGDKERCLALDMDDLISKPIAMVDMHALLNRHLRAA